MGRNRKLTPMEEQEVWRLRRQEKIKSPIVAEQFGISTRTVRRICNRVAAKDHIEKEKTTQS